METSVHMGGQNVQSVTQTTGTPPAGKSQHARNFFLYFLSFVLLYMVVISIGGVLFYIINKSIPLPGVDAYVSFSTNSLRYHLSTLIIGTPIFLWLSWKIHRECKNDETMRSSGLRRWLTYLTMIVAALISIGDLIFLIYTLLGGDTTIRFILKSLVVLILASGVMYYYLADIKFLRSAAATDNRPQPKIFFMIMLVLALVSIVAGAFFIESPVKQRLRKQDEARIQSLQNLQYTVEQYYFNFKVLPGSLSDLTLREGQNLDPVTSEPYEYQTVSPVSYRLCANFATSNKEQSGEIDSYGYYGSEWLHDAEKTCFDRSVTPDPKAINFPTEFAPIR